MKKKIKKVLTGICLAVALLLCGIPAPKVSAAYTSCLDVRDYGVHRYSQRTYVYNMGEVKREFLDGYILNERGRQTVVLNYKVTYKMMRLSFCVCGLGKTEYYEDYGYVTETTVYYR
ncbi:MAG: hypothetical protein IJL09_10210 [Lachnospiraceae bacterium]|nr:hypothetical protein [Lachnospiraceae bacterium]